MSEGVVITIVYDGPPRAGKTTSVRALAASFGREVYTPEEVDGRTVYFDWLEHIGGRFEGLPIRCQIVSIPGQRHWEQRRAHFLERADVVVFVADTTAEAWPETVARLGELRKALDERGGAPVGLVLQANKRDCADAVAATELQQLAAQARTAVIETVADNGTGVREAFVFAVRLALDRVRAEHADLFDRPGFGGAPNELLALLGAEPKAPPPASDTTPRPPSTDEPSGFVWPPVDGRILLRSAAATPPTVALDEFADWTATSDGWTMHSSATAVFDNVELARARLIETARQHVAFQDVISRDRCIVLTTTGDGRWRLWQIVRTEPSLRALGRDELLDPFVADCTRAAAPFEATLDTVGVDQARPVFIGFLPGTL